MGHSAFCFQSRIKNCLQHLGFFFFAVVKNDVTSNKDISHVFLIRRFSILEQKIFIILSVVFQAFLFPPPIRRQRQRASPRAFVCQ